MSKEYVFGIDIGTQGTKAALFDLEGNKAGESFEASELIYTGPGRVYQEPLAIYGSVVRTIRKVMEKSGILAKQVSAIGIDAQMAGIMGIDEEFEAVGLYDSWLDTGCEPYIQRMKEVAEEEIIQKTGGPVTYAHGPKILFRKEERPEEYVRIRKFVLPGVYVAGKMCGLKAGQAWVDYTHLHFSGFADNEKKRWDEALLHTFGIAPEKLPEIVPPWKIIGSITEQTAQLCGLAAGIKVVAGCGDSAASSLGAGIVEKNMIYDVAGTASVFSCSTDRFTPDLKHRTLLFARSVIDGLYIPLAYISGGGMCLKWFCDMNGKNYEYWNQAAAQVKPGSENLYFVPHFSGRTCPNDPNVKGGYWGLSFFHKQEHMYRSIMESIAYEYAYYFSILKEQNPSVAPKCIYGAGGGTRSGIFNQIKADTLGLCYQPLPEADTAVYASAMLAAFGVGRISDLKKNMSAIPQTKIYHPVDENYKEYEKRRQIYIRLLETVSTFGNYLKTREEM